MKIKILEENEFNELKSLLNEIKNKLDEDKKSNPLSEKWLDNQDICQILNVSPRTVQNYRDTRLLPYSKLLGKIYYKASDVEELLNKNYKNGGYKNE